eukprot:jgi/Ulvmu1/1533/UM011_0263.1
MVETRFAAGFNTLVTVPVTHTDNAGPPGWLAGTFATPYPLLLTFEAQVQPQFHRITTCDTGRNDGVCPQLGVSGFHSHGLGGDSHCVTMAQDPTGVSCHATDLYRTSSITRSCLHAGDQRPARHPIQVPLARVVRARPDHSSLCTSMYSLDKIALRDTQKSKHMQNIPSSTDVGLTVSNNLMNMTDTDLQLITRVACCPEPCKAKRGKKRKACEGLLHSSATSNNGPCVTKVHRTAASSELRATDLSLLLRFPPHIGPVHGGALPHLAQLERNGGRQIMSLGRVEYLNPRFHTSQIIWPVGFQVLKLVKVGTVRHIVRVSIVEDLMGPRFKVKLGDRNLVDCTCHDEVWKSISGLTGSSRGTASAQLARFCGLTKSDVFAKLVTMQGSAYLINLLRYPDGSLVPARAPIPASEQRLHKQICARCRTLPSHVTAVHAPKPECTGACNICGSESEDDDVRLLTCAGCRIMVHNTCYDCPLPEVGAIWLCEVCDAGLQHPPACALCAVLGGGAMRFTRCGRWAHSVCCLWVPGCILNPGSPPCLEKVSDARKAPRMTCCLCKQRHGAHIQCCFSKCCTAFHAMCGRLAGWPLQQVDVNSPLNEDMKARVLNQKGFKEGVTCDNGLRLLSYCRKHISCGSDYIVLESTRNMGTSQCEDVPGVHEVANGMALPVSMTLTGAESQSCARLLAWNADRRRGIKQPDTRAVALRKRRYITEMPALERGCDVPVSTWNRPRSCGAVCLEQKASGDTPLCSSVYQSHKLLQSDADRFQEMNASMGARLTHGKSGVHGMGVFARLPIRAGDWVVEYQGELIRSIILEVREKAMYAKCIGTGTYTFQLPQGLCLDATMAGNAAHLMNHSCSSNCFSAVKAIPMLNQASGQVDGSNKVVLIAKRDIPSGAELTYDYRFCSDGEQLACFCGSSRCRGTLNSQQNEQASQQLYIQRHEVDTL